MYDGMANMVRRVVASTDAATELGPLAMLDALHQSGDGLSVAKAESYLTAVHEGRKDWRGKR